MQKLKIAASAVLKDKLQVDREVVKLSTADFTEVSAVVIDIEDYRKGGLNKVDGTALGIPVFLYLRDEENTPEELVGHVVGVISDNLTDRRLFGRQIDEAAKRYEAKFCLLSSAPWLNTFIKANLSLTAPVTRAALTSDATLRDALSTTSTVKSSSVPTSATRTLRWAIF